jgi:phytoene dehydrogenase-like protein
MTQVAVVGGGLAGLVAARRLAADGLDVTLFERRKTVGGRVRSVHEDGYVFDRGFQVLFTAYPAARRELDYDALDLRSFTNGATIARPGRRSVLAAPTSGLGDLSDTVFNTDVRLADKYRLFTLGRSLAGRDAADHFETDSPQSIDSYLESVGFSERFRSDFAAPFYGGITLDRSLSTDAGVFRYTFAMLRRGNAAVPAEGMGAIPAQLAERARAVGVTIETDARVDAVQNGAAGGTPTVELAEESVAADAVVVATDPGTAAALTDVDGIPTGTRGCVTQYYDLPGHVELATGKKLVLNAADADPNQVAPLSAVAPTYAPDDRTLLSATWLGTQDRSEEALAARAREVLGGWYPARRFEDLDLLRTERIDVAQFDQPPGFRDRLPDVRAPEGAVYLAGDHTEWSSIQGALESGRTAARAVRADL